ncbi:hypothetical protein BSZ21_05850 [Bradyrhizobium canariense]|uniref:hypothetical protein n=1 Tax=Bradyrhizobium canariense TaxID=255045 RepID=UPI000A18F887|nr:hypothetical protein [Bradyrhizobium canariense]OSI74431.1 hypothetical protein BSZ21_05850 [Bradyrhizobium canariense]
MASDQNDVPVLPFMRVLANGVTKDGKLKATLIVTPLPDKSGTIQLADWPSAIVKYLRKLDQAVPDHHGKLTNTFQLSISDADPCKGAAPMLVDAKFSATPDDSTDVDRLWREAIEGKTGLLQRPWTELAADIGRSMQGLKHKGDPQASYAGAKDLPDIGSFTGPGAIVAKPHNPLQQSVVKGIVSNAQAQYAAETEAARSQRMAAKLVSGPYLPGDTDDKDDPSAKEESAALPAGAPLTDKELSARLKERRREELFKRLKTSIEATDTARTNSAAAFTAVKTYLTTGVAPQTAPKTAAPKVVAPKQQVLGGSDMRDRAGHVYGAWTQRSTPVATVPKNDADEACASLDELARLHGVYYSLQGDPILSRFFGFAFDIEFDQPKNVVSDKAVWLAPDGVKNSVWTKALFFRKDKAAGHFWPASRFDGSADGAAFAAEQRHGVFDLGLGHSSGSQNSGAPRYDLTSLDVRGAVSGARDALDLGSRHRTIGWTLLDRGRADQVARDLAVAEHQINANACGDAVVLHAEELTIGRRLDVAAARDGTDITKLEWRSLMNRFVEFTNLNNGAKQHLNRIVAERLLEGKILDESSFQLLARSMPLLGPNSDGTAARREVEAVVEEAIQTWDGTPLGALAQKAVKEKCVTALLPIKRAYDLPHSKSHLRPPPLRFGVGYVFAMRSVFLGGGSPTVEEAKRIRQEVDKAWTLPPGANQLAQPRRYLRHEGIDAPILMLPSGLTETVHGAMGFEAPGQATVRSLTAADQPHQESCVVLPAQNTPPGQAYVPVKDRANPNKTARVFIAPMVGFDFASRHRVFDNGDTAVLGGGLLDVEFGDQKPRFPVAIVKRNTGFDGERLVYRRTKGSSQPGTEKDSDGLGATLFVPKAPAGRKPGQGYLPDPAAQTMSVRLRICGADNYLDGDILVDLYAPDKQITYPHALPLVVTVEKSNGPRKDLARKVTEVVTGDPAAIMRMGAGDTPVPDAAGKGVRVRHLKVVLAQGEQFDLEVTCLPKAGKLGEWFSPPETIGVQHLAALGSPQILADLNACCQKTPLADDLKAFGAAARVGFAGKPPPELTGIDAISAKLLDCARNRWPLAELASPTTLRVTHAVNAPVDAPSLEQLTVLRPAKPTAISPEPTPGKGGTDNPDLVPGSSTLVLSGEILVDLEQTDMIDIVATVVNGSGKPFDDKTRGRGLLAKRTGRWPRITDGEGDRRPVPKRSVFGFDVDPDGRTHLPREVITLLRIQNLPDPRAAINGADAKPFKEPANGRLTRLDLRVLHAAAVSGGEIEIPIASPKGTTGKFKRKISVTRPHELSDTKARELSLHAVSYSRFAGTFETAPMFSIEGEEHLLQRRQPLQPQDQTRSGPLASAWSSATERPAPCAAKTPTLFFSMNRCARMQEKGVRQFLERECGVRLRFDRGMFSSGEGERIAVVLWPPNIREQSSLGLDQNWVQTGGRWMQLSDFNDSDLGEGGQFVSRWGGDPIRSDPEPQKSFFMPWSAFNCWGATAHSPEYIPSVQMPVSAAAKDGEADPAIAGFLEVALLTFEPYFDIDREEWFVDIPLKLAAATDPFIRFGLVRYQPHSIRDDLKVSTPVRVWTQLPPRRHAVVHHSKAADVISVCAEVGGLASDGIKPLPDNLKQRLLEREGARAVWERLQRPKMTLRLVHEAAPTKYGKHQTDILSGGPVSAVPKLKNGEFVWTLNASIPEARINDLGPGLLFALIEEVEERLSASYPNEPIALFDVLTVNSIRESGPRFLARIPFMDV